MTEDNEVIVVQSEPEIVEVFLTNTEVIEVNTAIPGPRGPQGEPGGIGDTGGVTLGEIKYVHSQGVATTVWNITHPLAFYPTVTVVDSAGTAVEGSVQYTSATTIVLTFAYPFSGVAYLS